ncbi:helix-turn-helix transcriptional regulator [Roseibium sp.]|uniref:helix-turn-helix transcriptional regulator n=1 Tax=Roseibium sp. TaxID=1936156 RepID=UPI003A97EAD6
MRTDDFADAIAVETDADRLWSLAGEWLTGHGFDRVLHLSVSGDLVSVRTTLGQDFETYYRDRNFEQHDPFLTYCLPASGPISTGAAYLSEYEYLTEQQADVIRAAGEAGFQAGFSVVTRRDQTGCEAWNVGSTLSRSEVEKIRAENGSGLRLGLAALRTRLSGPVLDPLSVRESQCLRLLGQGLRTKTIAYELGIACVTVELHLRNARLKLGAATREHAVALYSRLRTPDHPEAIAALCVEGEERDGE